MARQVNVTEERIEFTAVDKMGAVVKQAQGQVRELRSSIDTVKNALAAVGVTVGVGAMLQLYRDTLAAVSALDDMEESTGAAVSTLSAMSRVAKVGGQDFNFVTESMGRMIKGLKGADEEGQAAAYALQQLGISAKNADGTFRDQGEVMVEVAQKLAKYADSGNKVALVQDLYGKGAQKLLPYLKDLADGTDRHATVTKEQAAQAEEAEKNIRRLQLTFEDARRELVIGITPAVIDFTNRLIEAAKASGGLIAGLATMGTAGTGNVGARLKEIDKEMRAAQAGQSGVANFFTFGVSGAISGISESRLIAERQYLLHVQREQALKLGGPGALDARDLALRQTGVLNYQSPDKNKPKGLTPYESAVLSRQQEAAKAAMGDNEFIATQLDIQAGKYGKLTEAQKQHLLQLAAEAAVQKDLARQREEEIKGREEAAKAVNEYNEKMAALAEHYLDTTSASRALIREEEQLNLLLKQGFLTEQQYQEIMTLRSERARAAIVGMSKEAELAAAAGNQIGLSFASALDRIVDGSARSVRALDVVKAAALDVAKVLWGRQVTEPLAAGIGGAISKYFGTSTLPDATVSTGPFGGLDAGAIAAMELHGGGIVGLNGRPRYIHPAYFEGARRMHSGGLAGDEVPAVLQVGEKVLKRGESGGGAITIVQHNNFAVGIRGEVRAELAMQLPQIAAVSRAAVEDARRRGA